jgi:hypothetical protein
MKKGGDKYIVQKVVEWAEGLTPNWVAADVVIKIVSGCGASLLFAILCGKHSTAGRIHKGRPSKIPKFRPDL